MKNSILFLLLLSLLSVGCSVKKTSQKDASIDLSELDETPIEDVEADSVTALDSEILSETEPEQEELEITQEGSEPYSMFDTAEEDLVAEETDEEADDIIVAEVEDQIAQDDQVDNELVMNTQEVTKIIEKSEYVIQKNDTLMYIAWKIYGDHSRWRELKNLNLEKTHEDMIQTGDKLSFNRPDIEFKWAPEGSPYLIQNADTLGSISKTVYENPKHWKAIWYNNRDLIRNPNLIFAGFTIYYKDLELINEREIASKMRMFKPQK